MKVIATYAMLYMCVFAQAKEVLPNETVVYPGHGAPTTIGMEKAENPFFR